MGEDRSPGAALAVASGPDSGGSTSGGADPATSRLESVLGLLRAHPDLLSGPVPTGRPRSVGRYELAEELGSGGFGRVFLGYDPLADRVVAVKAPRPDRAGPEAADGLLMEARAVARLTGHDNVVPVWDVVEQGGTAYIVSEFCEGGSLDRWLRSRGGLVSPRLAARIVAGVADGVRHAHEGGVLHRDLKPANVLLRRLAATGPDGLDFVPRVADFGLARHGEVDAVGDRAHGTRGYMAPEQAGGRPGEIGPATDVHGLGALLDAILKAGRSPSARPVVPLDLDRIVRRCLRADPAARYASAGEVADALRRHLAGDPIGRGFGWKHARSWARRRPMLAASMAAAALALAVARPVYLADRRWAADRALAELETVGLGSIGRVLPRLDPTDPRVAARLGDQFAGGGPREKLAAALALAPTRADARRYAYDRWLDGPAEDLGVLAPLLADRVPGLVGRLEAELPALHPSDEARDGRRANAAAALIALGRPEAGYRLLRFEPDPLARSILVHRLGPAGIPARALLDRLRRDRPGADPDEVGIRRALVLALGESPIDAPARIEAERWLLGRFEDDPDPGVHGAVKWCLGRWSRGPGGEDLAGRLREAESRLAKLGPRPGFGWRVGPLGMTFVTFEDAEAGRAVEIADAEVTVARMLAMRRAPYFASVSPGPDYPFNGATYLLAAEFCDWLGRLDPIVGGRASYRPGDPTLGEPRLVPADGQLDRDGYRMPTDREFEVACRAGTTTRRYHGDSAGLLPKYAWIGPLVEVRSNPVARLKPNDLGLFDMLGNLAEVCQESAVGPDPTIQAVFRGGHAIQSEYQITSDARIGPRTVNYSTGGNEVGVRVARTTRPRGAGRPRASR